MQKSQIKVRNSLIVIVCSNLILISIFLLIRESITPMLVTTLLFVLALIDGLFIGIYAPYSVRIILRHNANFSAAFGLIGSILFLIFAGEQIWDPEYLVGAKIGLGILFVVALPVIIVYFIGGGQYIGAKLGFIIGKRQVNYVEQENIDNLEKKYHKSEKNANRVSIHEIELEDKFALVPPETARKEKYYTHKSNEQ